MLHGKAHPNMEYDVIIDDNHQFDSHSVLRGKDTSVRFLLERQWKIGMTNVMKQ
jgi:hypothetical protein